MQKKLSQTEILESLKEILKDPAFEKLPLYTRCHVNTDLPDRKHFSNFEDIAFQALDKALLTKYSDVQIKTDKKLIFFTWVIPSGLGDLSMQIYISDMIAKKYPDLNIELVTLINESSPIPQALKSNLPHHIIKYSHPKLPKFSNEIMTLLRKAFSIIEIPTAYFDFENLKKSILKDNPSPPIISCIGEYGFLDTVFYNPSTRNRSMGLHFLEKGLLILDKQAPQKRDPNHYFAYLIKESGVKTYLLSILINRKDDSQNLTLTIPNLTKILPHIQDLPFDRYGIKEIQILDTPKNSIIEVQQTGKTLTIQHQPNISPQQIQTFMNTCNPFIGVRGDGSFTENLTTDALFFYDALEHALPFLYDLSNIAHSRLLPYFSLCEFLKLQLRPDLKPESRALQIAELLEDPALFIGMKKLKELLSTEYSFNETLENLIKQNFAYNQNPELQAQDVQIFSEALQSKDLSTALKQV